MFEGIFRPMHLLVILVIVLIIWGPSKLAGLGKGLGEGIRNFKKSVNEAEDDSKPPTINPDAKSDLEKK